MADWFRFFPALWDADTLHLTAEQDGIYGRLIRHYMVTRKPLPDSDQALASIARVGLEELTRNRDVIRRFFYLNRGKLRHRHCEQELYWQVRLSEKRTKVAKMGAEKMWQNQRDKSFQHASEHARETDSVERERESSPYSPPSKGDKNKNGGVESGAKRANGQEESVSGDYDEMIRRRRAEKIKAGDPKAGTDFYLPKIELRRMIDAGYLSFQDLQRVGLTANE